MKSSKLKERARERRFSLSSELQNISLVRNKGEQVQLEKKQRLLAKAMEKQSVGLENKKRELIGLTLNTCGQPAPPNCATQGDARRGFYRQTTATTVLPPKDAQDGRPQKKERKFLLSRSRSLSGIPMAPSTHPTVTDATTTATSFRSSSFCPHVKPWQSLGSPLGRRCRMCELQTRIGDNGRWRCNNNDYDDDDEDDDEDNDEYEYNNNNNNNAEKKATVDQADEGNIGKLLPPPCLMSIHEQNSLKEARVKAAGVARKSAKFRKAVPEEKNGFTASIRSSTAKPTANQAPSWHSLSNCRYLRMWQNRWYCYNHSDSNQCSKKAKFL